MDTNALHTNTNIDLKAMAAAQQTDTSLQNDCSSLKLKAMPLPTSDVHILCDTSTGVPRPYVPERFRRAVFDCLHCLSHPSIWGTQKLITASYVAKYQ